MEAQNHHPRRRSRGDFTGQRPACWPHLGFKSVRFFVEKLEQAGIGQSPIRLPYAIATGVLSILRGYSGRFKSISKHKWGNSTVSPINK
jgi:hypothetical protein